MKVNELVALLSQMPANADVVVKGYEDGVDDVANVKLVRIRKDVYKEWYYGRPAIENPGDAQAVLISAPERQPD